MPSNARPRKGSVRSGPRPVGVFVLGMHRSGTSAATGAAKMLGARMARDLLDPSPHNPAGYWEPTLVKALHQDMITALGGHWSDWTRVDPPFLEAPDGEAWLRRATDFLTGEFAGADLFVIKDPRACRFMPLWRAAFERADMDLRVLMVLRDPMEVAASLAERDQLAESRAAISWLRHMIEAERGSRDLPRAVISYDGLLTDWRTSMISCGAALGVDWPRRPTEAQKEIDAYIDPASRHHRAPPGHPWPSGLGPWLSSAYGALRELEARPADPSGPMAALDVVAAAFDQATDAFAPLMADELQAGLQRLNEQRHAIKSELARAKARIEQLAEGGGVAQDVALQSHRVALRLQAEEIEALRSARANLETEIAEVIEELETLARQLTAPVRRIPAGAGGLGD